MCGRNARNACSSVSGNKVMPVGVDSYERQRGAWQVCGRVKPWGSHLKPVEASFAGGEVQYHCYQYVLAVVPSQQL